MMTLPKNLSSQLIDFANEANAALNSRIAAMRTPGATLPHFEPPTLEGFVARFGVTPAQLDGITLQARCHFLTIQSRVIIQGGLLGVWPFEAATRYAAKYLGWQA